MHGHPNGVLESRVSRASSESPPALLPLVLTHVEDVERQPVEEGVADQLGKEQTQGELHHTLQSMTEGVGKA